ncbi:EG45-like domain containing protein [Lotus japonicus]|uniref:EG45-like domain containing protein n=1 Tax=Lotus japonicus TaxID=34305 RepID=UPI00258C34D7|nr:EG45-like domain containing protein [Lotus japonicus]
MLNNKVCFLGSELLLFPYYLNPSLSLKFHSLQFHRASCNLNPSAMSKLHLSSFLSCLILLPTLFFPYSLCDVGTAARYKAPYLPTACFGKDASEFPSNNMFGSAGEGIWDNGAACGRQYQVRCISAAAPRTCVPGQSIQIKIVDRAQSSVSRPSAKDTSMVLSTTAFQAIANASASLINIEFQQV